MTSKDTGNRFAAPISAHKINNMAQRRHSRFFLNETACRCGCGTDNWRTSTMNRIHYARVLLGQPMVVTRWCTCAKHNATVTGNSRTTSHLTGYAVDIAIPATAGSRYRTLLIQCLLLAGFNRIGIYKHHVHADNDPDKPRHVMWYK
jgi:hypothetical protein